MSVKAIAGHLVAFPHLLCPVLSASYGLPAKHWRAQSFPWWKLPAKGVLAKEGESGTGSRELAPRPVLCHPGTESTYCDARLWLNFLCASVFYITRILKSDLIKDNLFPSLCQLVFFHWIMQTKRGSKGAWSNPPRKSLTFLEVEFRIHLSVARRFSCV